MLIRLLDCNACGNRLSSCFEIAPALLGSKGKDQKKRDDDAKLHGHQRPRIPVTFLQMSLKRCERRRAQNPELINESDEEPSDSGWRKLVKVRRDNSKGSLH